MTEIESMRIELQRIKQERDRQLRYSDPRVGMIRLSEEVLTCVVASLFSASGPLPPSLYDLPQWPMESKVDDPALCAYRDNHMFRARCQTLHAVIMQEFRAFTEAQPAKELSE